MSRKRRNTSSPESDAPPAKRRSISSDYDSSDDFELPEGNQRPQVDATTGQSGAFPGLVDNDEVFYGPAADGIDYLRMVRSERKDIPELLTSIKASADTDANGGYWFDGAYTAQPDVQGEDTSKVSVAQQHYYESLLRHFALVRASLKCTPPLRDIEALGTSRPISFPAESRPARAAWEAQLLDQVPHPVQLSCMDAESVQQAINLVTKKMYKFFRSDNVDEIERVGAWLWALLGRFPDRGELGSEEISDVRALARKAYEVTEWLNTEVQHRQDHVMGVNEDSDDDHDIDNLMTGLSDVSENRTEEARDNSNGKCDMSGLYAESRPPNVRLNIKIRKEMILDMVTTVVGESYGQRDLLDLRKPWPSDL